MADRYRSFAQLRECETEGVDYRISVTERESVAAIIAPHGGCIEPHTSEIAAAIAQACHSLYCFEGLQVRPHRDLHITSTRFDEPRCLALLKRCEIVVSAHGLSREHEAVYVGGRDDSLRDAICANLNDAGFQSEIVSSGGHAAILQNNICNKGAREKGVQLEITMGLRNALRGREDDLAAFAKCVRDAISSHQPG